MSAEDRPGDRDHQQAADLRVQLRRLTEERDNLDRQLSEALAARAEEAARWQARIEAIVADMETIAERNDLHWSFARRLRAVLDGERVTAPDDALRDALRVHHPVMRSETGPFSGCCCGQVRLGEDVIAHVVGHLRAALDGADPG